MTIKNSLIALALLSLAFASGYYLAPVKVETKTVEVEHKETEKERDKHQTTTTTEITHPDGTKEKTTTTTTDSKTDSKSTTDKSKEASKLVEKSSGTLSISALAGVQLPGSSLLYGGAVSRNIIGPITAGLWGLNNGTVGCSVGLNF